MIIVCPHCGAENSPLAGEELKNCLACGCPLRSSTIVATAGWIMDALLEMGHWIVSILAGFGILVGIVMVSTIDTVFQEVGGMVVALLCIQIVLLGSIVRRLDKR